jgi:hypothetical protein
MAVRPYAAAVNNRFETACISGLLFEYFASVLTGVAPSAALVVLVVAIKVLLVAFAVFRAARSYVRKWLGAGPRHSVRHVSGPELGSELDVLAGDAGPLSRPLLEAGPTPGPSPTSGAADVWPASSSDAERV